MIDSPRSIVVEGEDAVRMSVEIIAPDAPICIVLLVDGTEIAMSVAKDGDGDISRTVQDHIVEVPAMAVIERKCAVAPVR